MNYRTPVGMDKYPHRGPFIKCPACGVSFQYKICTDCGNRFDPINSRCTRYPSIHDERFVEIHWHIKAKPVYCDISNKFIIKKGFWKDIKCSINTSKHLHQACFSCGWSGIAETESEDA